MTASKETQALARLLAFAAEVQRARTFAELLVTTRAEIDALLGYTHVWLYAATTTPGEWRLVELVGAKRGLVDVSTPIHADAVLDEVARTQAPVVIADARTDTRRADWLDSRTLVHLPLAEPFVLGTGTFGDAEGCRTPTREELGYLLGMAGQIGAAAGRIRSEEASARRSASRFRRLTESGVVGIVISDIAGNITEANDAFLEIVGYTRDDLLTGKVSGKSLNTPERERTDAGARVQLRDRGMAPAWEKELLRKDGSRVPVLTGVALLEETAGEYVAFVLDLSERKKAEAYKTAAELLQHEKEVVEAANKELEAFSYSVAHDLRAPLRAIAGFVGAFLEDHGTGLERAGVAQLERVTTSASRMGEMIDGLLSLSRLSRAELRHERVDLAALARMIVEHLRAVEPDRAVRLVVPDELVVKGDPSLLRTLLENLLANAWKFTRRGSEARIEVGAEGSTYFLKDNGAGFDMAYANKLFRPFQRLHSTKQFEGSGIGLAIVERIVRRHGGTISADGAEGSGATFRFTLGE